MSCDRWPTSGSADVRLAARVRVKAAGVPPEPTEKDSETIAMRQRRRSTRCRRLRGRRRSHSRDRGYDLYAARGQAQRCVEVKGVWNSAASQGIRMTGNEILIATQQRTDYWLYVVDECSNGAGDAFRRLPRPGPTVRRTDQAGGDLPGAGLGAEGRARGGDARS